VFLVLEIGSKDLNPTTPWNIPKKSPKHKYERISCINKWLVKGLFGMFQKYVGVFRR